MKADTKLEVFILDVRAALTRLENNLIFLNKTSIKKVEKKILFDQNEKDELSSSSSENSDG